MSNIRVEKEKYIGRIILSKYPLNIFNIEDLNKLEQVIKNLGEEKELKLITIESDQKIFSAGVDVSDHSKENATRMIEAFHRLFYTMIELHTPTICLVKSGCFGGGCELALFCDLVIAAESAKFSQPEIKLGCYPPVSLVGLPLLVGNKKALELILTGNKISAKEACEIGLINHVFSDEEFDEKVKEIINPIVSNSSGVIKTTLKAYKKINYRNFHEKLKISEHIYINELLHLEDMQEGIKSFMEKRFPIWRNR